jgi:hypothetical protein
MRIHNTGGKQRLETKSSHCSQAGSEAGSETSETSDVSMKSVGSGGARDGGAGASMSSLVNRLHNGQTAATRAKAAEIQVLPYAGLRIHIQFNKNMKLFLIFVSLT